MNVFIHLRSVSSLSNPCSKLVLLLASNQTQHPSLDAFASTEAIQCTEIYEFVQRLGNKDYHMPYLQVQQYSNHVLQTHNNLSISILARISFELKQFQKSSLTNFWFI